MSRLATAMLVAALLAPAAFADNDKVAATVNGTPIPKIAVDRALDRLPDSEREKARAEILDFLIDNALIDQYLVQQKIEVSAAEVTARLDEIKKEIEKSGQTFEKVLASLKMSTEEFTTQITNDLRWEKFAIAQCTDKNLKALFDQNTEMFDGSMVRARHILIDATTDAQAIEAAKAELTKIRQSIEAKATEAVAKLPADADATTREQEKHKQIETAFAEIAKDKSACPSKREGGDLSWFPRAGHMVEPFAKAAFALKPFEMSEPVQTQFGVHLILCTGKKPGTTVKFEDVKEEVKEIYCNRMREAIASHLKQTAKIVITPVK